MKQNNLAAISVSSLSVNYNRACALDNISFCIKKGEMLALIGPNGAGKSTIVQAIMQIIKIHEGEISFPAYNNSPKIGYLPQLQDFLSNNIIISAEEVIRTGLVSNKNFFQNLLKNKKEKLSLVYELIKVGNLKDKLFSDLSGGEKQKVLLARAVVSQPDILILDEPSSALDIDYKDEFFSIIKKINREQKMTILLVSHDIDSIANFAQKIIYVNKTVKFFGKVKDFCNDKNNYDGCFVRCKDHIIWHTHKKQ